MAKIVRKAAKLFGNTAGALENAQFGSLAASAPIYSKDLDVIQALSNFGAGWFSAVIGGNSPAIEDMNSLFLALFQQVAYLMQTGIPEYNSTTVYFVGSEVNDGFGNIYRCILDSGGSGISGIPLTTTTNWIRVNGPNTVVISSANSPYTLAYADNGKTFLVNTTPGAVVFNLPVAVLNFQFTVKDVTGAVITNNITIIRNGSELIENQPTNYIISEQWNVKQFTCDGTNWWVTIGAVPTTQKSVMKAGSLIPYAGASTPTGWFDCDGAAYVSASYPQLSTALSTSWATCTNPLTGSPYSAPSAGSFRVPDLRGAFIRGAGGPNVAGVTTTLAGYQADTTAKNGLTATAGIQSANHSHVDVGHTHIVNSTNQLTYSNAGAIGGSGTNYVITPGGTVITLTTLTASANLGNQTADHIHTITVGNGDAETRPDNVGVRWICKIWDAS